MKRERYEGKAENLLAKAQRSADPDTAAVRIVEHLERRADEAEGWQASMEEYLARAVNALQRADHARRAAAGAEAAADRILAERRREAERLCKNERARERYRQRRLTEPARVNKRTGMHALAIDVDATAYRAVKVEALRARSTIPKMIGEILDGQFLNNREIAMPQGPRWRRTGEGRRANQHTRIDVTDDTWQAIHIEATKAGLTLARWIGLRIEAWAARAPIQGAHSAQSQSSSHPLRNVDSIDDGASGREDRR